ncbi:MAG: hypothetical protein ACYCS8_10330 [Acidithiobacillus sp.]
MHVHAIVRPQSSVHNLWRRQNRTFGALGGNRFVWKGTAYELQEITDIDFLTKHPDVMVEITGKRPTAAPAFVGAPAFVAEVAPAPQPKQRQTMRSVKAMAEPPEKPEYPKPPTEGEG